LNRAVVVNWCCGSEIGVRLQLIDSELTLWGFLPFNICSGFSQANEAVSQAIGEWQIHDALIVCLGQARSPAQQ
jgi:hypothetical protein